MLGIGYHFVSLKVSAIGPHSKTLIVKCLLMHCNRIAKLFSLICLLSIVVETDLDVFREYLKSQSLVMSGLEERIKFITTSNDTDKPVSMEHLCGLELWLRHIDSHLQLRTIIVTKGEFQDLSERTLCNELLSTFIQNEQVCHKTPILSKHNLF